MKMTAFDIVTERIIEQLDKGIVPWKRSWSGYVPMNAVSKRRYNGVNLLLLSLLTEMTEHWKYPYFISFTQCKDKGGKIKKGSHTVPVFWWQPFEVEVEKDGEKVVETKFSFRYYRVFNIADTDLEFSFENEKNNPLEMCERIVDNYHGPHFDIGDPCYSPATDTVFMPDIKSFKTSENYYSTLFHELIHSTGSEKRLNRLVKDNKEAYAFEELVAELGAAFLCAESGISNEVIKDQASYIDYWRNRLSKDKKLIVQASSKAQKAVDYMKGGDEHGS